MTDTQDAIRQNLAIVRERMKEAAAKAGRPEEQVRLLVVSKKQSIALIQQAIRAGIRYFGENYPEEAAEKLAFFKKESSLEWDLIGHIQSRKAALVADGFNLIHSVDSLKIAEKLNRLRPEDSPAQRCLIEINIAAEENKDGYRLDSAEGRAHFYKELEAIASCGRLDMVGLMGMPPLQTDPEKNRACFAALRDLKDKLNGRFGLNLQELSMGTSHDYEIAIEEGATIIRLGEAILGKRIYQKE